MLKALDFPLPGYVKFCYKSDISIFIYYKDVFA
jgi:hypothetical protein